MKLNPIGIICYVRTTALGTWGLAFYAASLAVAQIQPDVAPSEILIRDHRYCLAMIQVGKMAQKQAYSVEVADFATKRVDEYTKMQQDVQDLAGKLGVQLPSDLGLNSLNLQAELEASPNAETFDAYYISGMRSYMREHLTDFQAQTQASKDQNIKAFTKKSIPIIESAANSADELNTKVQNKSTTARPKP